MDVDSSESCSKACIPSSLLDVPGGHDSELESTACIGFARRETAIATATANLLSFSLVNLKKKKKKTRTLKIKTEPGEATMDGEAQSPGLPKEAKVDREPEDQFLIPHFEIIGKGTPSPLLGLPGDVYVDISTPSEFRLYGKYDEGWLLWLGVDKVRVAMRLPVGGRRQFEHPFLKGYFLWVLESYIGWVTQSGIRASVSTTAKRESVKSLPDDVKTHKAIVKALKKDLVAYGVELDGNVDTRLEMKSAVAANDQGQKRKGEDSSQGVVDGPGEKRVRVEGAGNCFLGGGHDEDLQMADAFGGIGLGQDHDMDSPNAQDLVDAGLQCDQGTAVLHSSIILPRKLFKQSPLYNCDFFPVDCCIGDAFRGIQFPEDAGTLRWEFNGMETVDTYVEIEGVPEVPEDDERFHVQYMVKQGRDAAAPSCPVLHVLELPEEKINPAAGMGGLADLEESLLTSKCGVMAEAVKYLSRGEAVAFVGYKNVPQCQFSVKGMKHVFGNVDGPVICQDANLRYKPVAPGEAKADLHREMSFREFMKECNEVPSACVNLLDYPNFTPSIPPFISSLDDLSHAWMTTVTYSWVKPSKVALGGNKRILSKDATQRRALMGISQDNRERRYELSGPETVRFDSQRMMNWVLMTKAGFYTFVHHDSNGLLTWVMVLAGCKIWGLWNVQDHSSSQRGQWKTHLERGFDKKKSDGDLFNALLIREAVLVMPPGFWHEVFTPVNTITFGGHTYLWECMHLTEYHMHLDHVFSDYFTNTDHPGVYRGIIRMILALRHWDPERVMKRDCFIAGATIVMDWNEFYHPYDPTGVNLKATDCCSLEEDGELKAAKAFIKHVFRKMNLEDSPERLDIEREIRHRMIPNAREEFIDPSWFQISKYVGESRGR